MPTPIGHALGGAIVALALAPRAGARRSGGSGQSGRSGRKEPGIGASLTYPTSLTYRTYLTYLTAAVIAACLPDIDFLWGRHNMQTHSVGFALLIAILVFAWRRDVRLAVICFLAVESHVLFDWLGSDDSPPLGVMAWWPFTSRFYFGGLFVFDAISRRYWLPGFVRHNVLAVLRELAILVPITAALGVWRRSRRKPGSGIRDRGSAW